MPYTYFPLTHGIMLGRQGGKCVFRLMRLTKCKDVFEVLSFSNENSDQNGQDEKIALSILFDWRGETSEAFVVRRAANLLA